MKEQQPERHHPEEIDAASRLLAEVRERTGVPVEVRADRRVRARGRAVYVAGERNLERHLVLYDPEEGAYLDHLVAHECGHILRLHAAPPEERTLPVMTANRRETAIRSQQRELERLVASGIPLRVLVGAIPIWLTGTVAQLSDTPSDIRIERWLWSDHPELRDAQARSLREQARSLHHVLRPEVGAFTPRPIWAASNAMNGALLKAVAHFLDDRRIDRPYARTPFASVADELLEIVDSVPDEGLAGDRALSERWAQRLGFAEWLEWRRLDELPESFRHAWE